MSKIEPPERELDGGDGNEAPGFSAKLSKSLAGGPFCPNQETVRSTTQRRSMPYEGSLMLGQIDQAARRFVRDQRGSIIQAQLALLPISGSPEEMARLTLPASKGPACAYL